MSNKPRSAGMCVWDAYGDFSCKANAVRTSAVTGEPVLEMFSSAQTQQQQGPLGFLANLVKGNKSQGGSSPALVSEGFYADAPLATSEKKASPAFILPSFGKTDAAPKKEGFCGCSVVGV